MANQSNDIKDREPAEGGRESVNVPHAADEADANPNRPGDPARARKPAGRSAEADVTSQPTRDENRDEPGEHNRHQPRRRSL